MTEFCRYFVATLFPNHCTSWTSLAASFAIACVSVRACGDSVLHTHTLSLRQPSNNKQHSIIHHLLFAETRPCRKSLSPDRQGLTRLVLFVRSVDASHRAISRSTCRKPLGLSSKLRLLVLRSQQGATKSKPSRPAETIRARAGRNKEGS